MLLHPNAKLNLNLAVTGRRADGYHLLRMLNVPVSLCDEMTVELAEDGRGVLEQSFEPPIDCDMSSSTIAKAWRFMMERLPAGLSVSVSVRKLVPSGAGLGGGSSDAAFFVRFLCERFGLPVDDRLLAGLADHVGADVPFFMHNRPAVVEGIGEIVRPVDGFPELQLVIVMPDFGVSTKDAYRLLNFPLTKRGADTTLDTSRPADAAAVVAMLHNDLERPVESLHPEIGTIRSFLREQGAVGAMMTGSGAAVFGIAPDRASQIAIAEACRHRFPGCRVFDCTTPGA